MFIVHGHNTSLKETLARLVEKLGLEAIILHEQVNSGMTIIEKLEKYSDVSFAIILYTLCDLGKAIEKPYLRPRVRQSIVFEHGLFVGKLTIKNVCALIEKDVDQPGDLSGILYTKIDIV